jgi:hypothetical protein
VHPRSALGVIRHIFIFFLVFYQLVVHKSPASLRRGAAASPHRNVRRPPRSLPPRRCPQRHRIAGSWQIKEALLIIVPTLSAIFKAALLIIIQTLSATFKEAHLIIIPTLSAIITEAPTLSATFKEALLIIGPTLRRR